MVKVMNSITPLMTLFLPVKLRTLISRPVIVDIVRFVVTKCPTPSRLERNLPMNPLTVQVNSSVELTMFSRAVLSVLSLRTGPPIMPRSAW